MNALSMLHLTPVFRVLGFCLLAVLTDALTIAAEPERVFVVRGTVVAPYADGTVSIKHQAGPGFMPAMTMPFNVDASDARDLVAGDEVEFQLRVGESASQATKFRRIGHGKAASSPAPAVSRRRLREGDTLPSFHLVDQDGRAFSESDLKGRSTLLTFVFTRCPVPDFCPRMSSQFQALQKSTAAQAAALRLLSISIDPDYDVPKILRAYGEHYGADFSRWTFATGETAEVDALRRAFAVFAEKSASGLDHALATALIDPQLRVVAIWRGNQWKPEEVIQALAAPTAAGTAQNGGSADLR